MATETEKFRYAAGRYLNWWLTLDRETVKAFGGPLTIEVLSKLLREYKVARTICGIGKTTDEKAADREAKLRRFVDALDLIRDTQPKTSAEAGRLVSDLSGQLLTAFERGCLSAVSKACWMMFRHPIAIYDSRTCKGIERINDVRLDGTYETYHRYWLDYFNDTAVGELIDAACEWLISSDYARNAVSLRAASDQEIRELVQNDWFRNRVVDLRLMDIGNPEERDYIHPAELALFTGAAN